MARLLISNDRGAFVRTPKLYEKLAKTYFENIKCHIRKDLNKIPYTHFIMEIIK